jgi:hypothetical protein
MKLLELVDKYLENPYDVHMQIHKGYHHPSSSSCKIKNEYGEEAIVGGCLRKIYWEHKGVKKTNPMTARGARICGVGRMVERFEIEQYKEMGIWRDNNVKFINAKHNISGEADCIVFDKEINGLRGVEIKSGYDYKFRTDVIGTPTKPGKPKFEHLLQTMIYVDYFKFPFNIIYIDRGNAARAEYEILLNDDGTPNINGKKLSNGISMPGCLARFKELEDNLKDSTLPRRDFQIKYSKDRLKVLRDSYRLSKKDREEFDKSGNVDCGDWQCSYCDYKDYCWKDGK